MKDTSSKNKTSAKSVSLVFLSSNTKSMKLTLATRKAIKANKALAMLAKSKKQSKGNKAKAQAPKLGKVAKREVCIALLTGERGFASRLVEKLTYDKGAISIRALQNNLGLTLKDSHAAILDGGKLTSKAPKEARIELGGYVNGRNTGARVDFLSEKQFAQRAGKCIVHWSADDNGIHGQYIGNPNQKGMCAVAVAYGGKSYFWQMEQDSNPNNKHERGQLKPATKNGVLANVK